MFTSEIQERPATELAPEAIREHLEKMVQDPAFRTSKRSVQFLRYVVEKTLAGAEDQIKERTIGVEVFGRDPSYDTNVDHVVRTAAIELRKRLAIYYGDEQHKSELRIQLVPGSYIPQFLPPPSEKAEQISVAAPDRVDTPSPEPAARPKTRIYLWSCIAALSLLTGTLLYHWIRPLDAQYLFWKPVIDTPGPVLIAVGDVPDGPPTPVNDAPIPVIHRSSAPTVPFGDTVTIARVLGILSSRRKTVIIRREEASSFSDLRQNPVVLIGAFNNEWSLRLTRQLRYTLALDRERHLIYIKDNLHPEDRSWSWPTDQPTENQGSVSGPRLQDYALISRIWNSDTGQVVVVIGGLYTYGTEAAGEFLSDPQRIAAIAGVPALKNPHSNLQIVLTTTVTDGTAGPPRVLAASDGSVGQTSQK
jgi:hypothetical protein